MDGWLGGWVDGECGWEGGEGEGRVTVRRIFSGDRGGRW